MDIRKQIQSIIESEGRCRGLDLKKGSALYHLRRVGRDQVGPDRVYLTRKGVS